MFKVAFKEKPEKSIFFPKVRPIEKSKTLEFPNQGTSFETLILGGGFFEISAFILFHLFSRLKH